MPTKFNARIAAKHDTEANWLLVEDSFVPLNGEIIVYHDASVPFDNTGQIDPEAKGQKIKIGDGNSTLANLDFVFVGLENQVLSHVQNTTIHITAAEKLKISQSVVAYVRSNDDDQHTHNLILSTEVEN